MAVALLTTVASRAAEESIAIIGATVIHPERELPAAVERDRTVIITGNRIVRIGRAPRRAYRPARCASTASANGWSRVWSTRSAFLPVGEPVHAAGRRDFNAVVPYADEVARNKARLGNVQVWLATA